MIASGKPCAKCGNLYPVMQCSHVYSTGKYPNIRFDPMNALPMCGRHHPYWWHLEPMESRPWFKKKYPARYAYLLKAKNEHAGWTLDDLKEISKKIKARDLKGLMADPELLDF